jgi:hypothetical protein
MNDPVSKDELRAALRESADRAAGLRINEIVPVQLEMERAFSQ